MKTTRLFIPGELQDTMLEHVISCLPEEACGMIGGQDDRVQLVLPAVNELHSPTAFRMAASDLVKHFYQLEEQNLDLIAIYHSHPNGPVVPSDQDLQEFNYPGVYYLIWAPIHGNWQMKGYRLDRKEYQEITLDYLRTAQP
jgi:proteasome lid subunit RPN8/RPN11